MPPCGKTTIAEDFNMSRLYLTRALGAAIFGLALIGIARADIKDYEFKLAEPTVTVGKDKIVTVQLVNKKTGKPVPDAVIFATRLDMAPDGMAEMATKTTRTRRRARQLPFQGGLRHGRKMAAVARRQGAGRNRYGRRQARHHGEEMKRAVLAGVAVAA